MEIIGPAPRNAFVALCGLAARERWCWKLVCTTCGHLHFRYALREIARGVHPDSHAWKVTKEHPALRRGSPAKELGPIPPPGPWPEDEGRALLAIVVGASLSDLAEQGPFPDWLGYLGLALHYSEIAECQSRALTAAWVPQLLTILPHEACARPRLQGILANSSKTVTWRDLEAVEKDLDH